MPLGTNILGDNNSDNISHSLAQKLGTVLLYDLYNTSVCPTTSGYVVVLFSVGGLPFLAPTVDNVDLP